MPKGYPRDREKALSKRSESCKKFWSSQAGIDKRDELSRERKGVSRPPEVGQKISESLKNSEAAKAHREKIYQRRRDFGYYRSESTKKKISEGNTGKTRTPEQRENIRNAKTGQKYGPWSDDHRAKIMASRQENGSYVFARNSKVEYRVADVLCNYGYRHTAEKPFYVNHPDGTRKVPDFVDFANRRVVEIWGRYWHQDRKLSDGKSHASPEEYREWYRTALQGPWACVIVWDDEVEAYLDSFNNEGVYNG